jgi:hypothetical protein
VKDAGALVNAVATLDDDRASLIRMAEAARRRVVEQYTVARLADDFRKLYSGCLRGQGREKSIRTMAPAQFNKWRFPTIRDVLVQRPTRTIRRPQ